MSDESGNMAPDELRGELRDELEGDTHPRRANRLYHELVDAMDLDMPACRECGASDPFVRSGDDDPWRCDECGQVPDDDRQGTIQAAKDRVLAGGPA